MRVQGSPGGARSDGGELTFSTPLLERVEEKFDMAGRPIL